MSRRAASWPGLRLLLVAAGVAVAVADPFTGSAPAANGVADNGAATSLTTVKRQDLSQQTQVSATLGYADASTVSVPSGTAPAELEQSQQSVASAQQTLAADQRALEQAQASLDADLRKVAVDCRGGNAAESGGSQQGGGSAGPCATDAQAVTADRQSVPMAAGKVQADQRALSAAQAALDQGEASAATYGQNAVYTMLPKVGQIVRRGEPLYAIGGAPAFLLYGGVPASRAFMPGMSAGADVAELNRNLRGYGAPSGDAFTATTTLAIERFQSAHHVPATGKVAARVGGVRAGRGPRDERDADGGLAGAGRAGAGDHLDSPRGDDRSRRVAADEHQGGRPGRHHAAGQLDHAGARLLRRHGGNGPVGLTAATGRARRRSRST